MCDLVSIIMPSYNTGKYICDSIDSVIAQTYTNWELIIIDDCSPDNSNEIIESYKEPRIRLLKNERNSGAAISRNYGLREAKGRYIAFIDSDDTWVKDKLEKQIKFIKENEYAFVYADYRICLNGVWENVIRTAPNKINKRKIYNYCYFSTITVMYDVEKVGLIQIEDLKKNNDYAMWIQALSKVDAFRQPECLSYYIKHDDSVSGGSKWKLIKYHYIMWNRGLHKSKIISVVLTINNLFHGVLKKIIYKENCSEMMIEEKKVL